MKHYTEIRDVSQDPVILSPSFLSINFWPCQRWTKPSIWLGRVTPVLMLGSLLCCPGWSELYSLPAARNLFKLGKIVEQNKNFKIVEQNKKKNTPSRVNEAWQDDGCCRFTSMKALGGRWLAPVTASHKHKKRWFAAFRREMLNYLDWTHFM